MIQLEKLFWTVVAWGCKTLGAIWEKAGKFDKARRYYQASCAREGIKSLADEIGSPCTREGIKSLVDKIGCLNLGRLLYLGHGGAKNMTEARRYFQKACDGGYGGGCFILALLYYADDGKEEKAKEYAAKAGSLEYNLRCYFGIDRWLEDPDPYTHNKYTEARKELVPIMQNASRNTKGTLLDVSN